MTDCREHINFPPSYVHCFAQLNTVFPACRDVYRQSLAAAAGVVYIRAKTFRKGNTLVSCFTDVSLQI